MTCSSSNTTGQRTDALEKGPFDPSARQYGSDGLSYVDFHAALNGEPDPQDPVNSSISRYLKQGRSEAFCREYRKGYEGAARSIAVVQLEGRFSPEELRAAQGRLCHAAGDNRAQDLGEVIPEART